MVDSAFSHNTASNDNKSPNTTSLAMPDYLLAINMYAQVGTMASAEQ